MCDLVKNITILFVSWSNMNSLSLSDLFNGAMVCPQLWKQSKMNTRSRL